MTRNATLALAVLALAIFSFCTANTYEDGKSMYTANCANCHMENGAGLGTLIPPLTDAAYLKAQRNSLPCILRFGLQDTLVIHGKTYAEQMPGTPEYSDIDITNLLNYVNSSWGNNVPLYTLAEVRALLQQCRREDWPLIQRR